MRSVFIFCIAICLSLFVACGTNGGGEPVARLPDTKSKDAHAKGAALFRTYCASCHNPNVAMIGPALKGWAKRVPSKDWLYRWVKNPQALLDEKDAYAVKIFEEYKAIMTGYPNMTNDQIDAIMAYVDSQ